jgi:hypothetical protein
MPETPIISKALYNPIIAGETPIISKALYNAVGGVPVGTVVPMDIGRTVSFSFFSVPNMKWSHAEGKSSRNLGLTFGFWVWSTETGKWVKGGTNV